MQHQDFSAELSMIVRMNINNEDIAVKTIAYRDLQSVGEFNYVFAMQAFADMQISEFALQNAASGFLCRVINDCPDEH